MCSLRKAINGAHTGIVYVHLMHACIYMHARLATPTNGSPMRARRTPTCCVRPRARVCACAIGRPRIGADTCERPSVGVDCVWLGSQAFKEADAFKANIGAWNTASVTTLSEVCAAFSAPGGAPPRRDALGGSSMRGAGRCARRRRRCARARVCADVWARACAGAHVCRYSCAYERRVICMYVCICIYMYTYIYICIIRTYTGICACVRDGYGRACGCTASNAHVRAIARADDAAVAIERARGYVRRYI